jgi:hypothetical protein
MATKATEQTRAALLAVASNAAQILGRLIPPEPSALRYVAASNRGSHAVAISKAMETFEQGLRRKKIEDLTDSIEWGVELLDAPDRSLAESAFRSLRSLLEPQGAITDGERLRMHVRIAVLQEALSRAAEKALQPFAKSADDGRNMDMTSKKAGQPANWKAKTVCKFFDVPRTTLQDWDVWSGKDGDTNERLVDPKKFKRRFEKWKTRKADSSMTNP